MQRPGEILAERLRQAKVPRDYSAAFREFYDTAERHASEYMQEADIRVACGTCSFCCYQWVRVLAHEAFAIVDCISTMEPPRRQQVLEQLHSYHSDSHLLSPEDQDSFHRACPLLIDGRCSVYPVRPSNCRRFHSLDSSHCQRSVEQPELWKDTPLHKGLAGAWSDMILAADYSYHLTGHDQTTYNLAEACLAALSNPALRRRWVQKKKALLHDDS
ncbi:MAG: YkgJ family cysteine cluster protein [Verrucomicrobiales bacterium]|nr:YkgJ family cysteine cluster protein [Verrucomicrobiales bacterium]